VDSVLEDVRRRALGDPATIGVLVIGSRSQGTERPDSDYDLVWILTDDELARRVERGEERQVKQDRLDVVYASPARLAEQAGKPGAFTGALLSAAVLVDETGEVGALLGEVRSGAERRAREDVDEAYDAYLNSFVRSLKTWGRGDELGGRLHASESMAALVRALCGVLGRWPPYHDELVRLLPELERGLDLPLGDDLREIVRTGDPRAQQRLEARVEALMTSRGFPHQWGDDLEPLKARRFE